MNVGEILKNVFIFRGIDDASLERLRPQITVEDIKKGEFILFEATSLEHLTAIVTGRAKLICQGESGRETVVGIAGPGETIGEISLLDGRPLPYSAKALTGCRIVRLPREPFLQYLFSNSTAGFEMLLELSRRLRDAHGQITSIATDRVEDRIIGLLLGLADKTGRTDGESVEITVPLTRQDIADIVGSTVETTIRILSKLGKADLVETRSKHLVIKDVDRLREQMYKETDF